MLLKYRKLILLISCIVLISVALVIVQNSLTSGNSFEKSNVINIDIINKNILVGMTFVEVTNFLNSKSVEFFIENKEEAYSKSDQNVEFDKQIIFGIADSRFTFGGWEKKSIFIIRIDENSIVTNIVREVGYSGL